MQYPIEHSASLSLCNSFSNNGAGWWRNRSFRLTAWLWFSNAGQQHKLTVQLLKDESYVYLVGCFLCGNNHSINWAFKPQFLDCALWDCSRDLLRKAHKVSFHSNVLTTVVSTFKMLFINRASRDSLQFLGLPTLTECPTKRHDWNFIWERNVCPSHCYISTNSLTKNINFNLLVCDSITIETRVVILAWIWGNKRQS